MKGVSTERIVELYAEAEVACVPSLYEGFSLPAVEAMACGVPVVGTNGGAVAEVIGRDGETGLIVPAGDLDALAQALLRALGDADLRARLGAAGRRRALDNFTWRRTAEATAEHYRALLDEQPARRADGPRLMLTVDFDRVGVARRQPASSTWAAAVVATRSRRGGAVRPSWHSTTPKASSRTCAGSSARCSPTARCRTVGAAARER